jgi:hypothetical protein
LLLLPGQLILFHPWEVGIDKHECRIGQCRKGRIVKDLLPQHYTGTTPVTAGKVKQDMPVFFSGYFPGLLHIDMPLRRGIPIDQKEQTEVFKHFDSIKIAVFH